MKRFVVLTLVVIHSVCLGCLVRVGSKSSPQSSEAARSTAHQGRPLTPAGELVIDAETRRPAVGAMPVKLLRSPEGDGPGGLGRYLIAVNSGYGIQFRADTNRGQQSLAVIDLEARGAPRVVQNVYFPAPQSAQVGAVFDPRADREGAYRLYVSGGVENRIWVLRFRPGVRKPISPESPGPDSRVTASFISVAGFSRAARTPRYNANMEPVYPLGIALTEDGDGLLVANNLADNLGIIRDVRGSRRTVGVELRPVGDEQQVYPYEVVAVGDKAYVSCWATGTLAVVDTREARVRARIAVGRHPTAMTLNERGTRLFVVNSNADSVSVIDTERDEEIERIPVGLAEEGRIGSSPEGLALSSDGATLYVANAHSHAVAVVSLCPASRGDDDIDDDEVEEGEGPEQGRSQVQGFIPTGQYPSAVAVAAGRLFIGNGKGTGFESSSMRVHPGGLAPNAPNRAFPAGPGYGGQYVVSLLAGNISMVAEPDALSLSRYTQQAMRNAGLVGPPSRRLFERRSPIRHIIYVIKENRTYDQFFGDLPRAGNGQPADGDPALAIFGAGQAARRPGGPSQNITPNHRALALRFGLLDRFFVNSEASPDGHNWSTAAFSSDYVDKAFRWSYSGRGRTYDYEGFNRLPALSPRADAPPILPPPVRPRDVAELLRRYIPYLHGGRDVAEPETLYLWDAAARAGLTYRNYGEFVATVSEADLEGFNRNRWKGYPDISPTVVAIATKQSLEGHFSPTFRNFDLETPDAMTVDSYHAAKQSGEPMRALVSPRNRDERFRGNSRMGEWLEEFDRFVEARRSGRGDPMPSFSIVRLSNDHTTGLRPGMPTPQFQVADNDFAVGILVEAVSKSPYWQDTAMFILEDDAQNGPDHVDAHRSPALIVSAYNRPGELVHEFHNTVSFIRTMEVLLGIEPMNQLDAAAVPVDIFQDEPDLRPYETVLPEVALDNLMNPPRNEANAHWVDLSLEQNLVHADMADPGVLNEIIWISVRGTSSRMPPVARLAAFDALRAGIASEAEEERELNVIRQLRVLLAGRD